MLGLLSFHGNGWIRQAAIIALESVDDEATIPYLLLRANDWVKPVRERAWAAIRSKLTKNHINILVENLPEIVQLTNKKRSNLTPLKEDIENFLIQYCDELEGALSKHNNKNRRAIYSLIFRSEFHAKSSFINKALNDNDQIIRLKTARYLQGAQSLSVPEKFITVLITDNWYALRLCGLRIAVSTNHIKTKEILDKLILDRSRPVREAARFYLVNLGEVTKSSYFRQVYIDEIMKGGHLLGALMGLAECGQDGDEGFAMPYLKNQRPKISSAAHYAVASLSSHSPTELLLSALCNEHPRYSRVAYEFLAECSSLQTLDKCQKYIVNEDLPQHIRVNAFKLLLNQSKWPKLIVLLNAISMKIEISGLVTKQMEIWIKQFNRSFLGPTDDQINQIRNLLEYTELPDTQRAFIESVISDF